MTRAAYPARRVGAGDSRAGYAPAIVPEFLRGDAQPACTPLTAYLFYADENTGNPRKQYTEARMLCAACPLKRGCDEWATANNEKWGVWGGRNRESGRKKRAVIVCADCGLEGRHDGNGRCHLCNRRRETAA